MRTVLYTVLYFRHNDQGERMVVERLGKLSAIENPGWFMAIPIIDNIAYRVRYSLVYISLGMPMIHVFMYSYCCRLLS